MTDIHPRYKIRELEPKDGNPTNHDAFFQAPGIAALYGEARNFLLYWSLKFKAAQPPEKSGTLSKDDLRIVQGGKSRFASNEGSQQPAGRSRRTYSPFDKPPAA